MMQATQFFVLLGDRRIVQAVSVFLLLKWKKIRIIDSRPLSGTLLKILAVIYHTFYELEFGILW
jgi:hypothetical protein